MAAVKDHPYFRNQHDLVVQGVPCGLYKVSFVAYGETERRTIFTLVPNKYLTSTHVNVEDCIRCDIAMLWHTVPKGLEFERIEERPHRKELRQENSQ